MRLIKTVLTVCLILNSFFVIAQINSTERKNRHAIGISLIPLTETILIPNCFSITGDYAYIIQPSFMAYSSISYFNKGKASFDKILGAGSNSRFNIQGGQIKFGLRYLAEKKLKNEKMTCNIIGIAGAISSHSFQYDIMLSDVFGNTKYYPNSINFLSKAIEIQYGKAIRISNKFNIATYFSFGFIAKSDEILPILRIPAIGSTGDGSVSPYINFSIDLFYNLTK